VAINGTISSSGKKLRYAAIPAGQERSIKQEQLMGYFD
jgi:hypothetical protein